VRKSTEEDGDHESAKPSCEGPEAPDELHGGELCVRVRDQPGEGPRSDDEGVRHEGKDDDVFDVDESGDELEGKGVGTRQGDTHDLRCAEGPKGSAQAEQHVLQASEGTALDLRKPLAMCFTKFRYLSGFVRFAFLGSGKLEALAWWLGPQGGRVVIERRGEEAAQREHQQNYPTGAPGIGMPASGRCPRNGRNVGGDGNRYKGRHKR